MVQKKPQNRSGNAKRWLFGITPNDRAALKYLKERHLYGSLTNAVRVALRSQCERDESEATKKLQAVQERVRKTCEKMHAKAHSGDSQKLAMWACWLREEDFARMAKVLSFHGFEKNAEAVRFAIRVHAELEGFVPENGW